MSSSIKNPAPETTNKTVNKRRQWLWFIGLWCAGFLTITTLGLLIKFFINLI